MVNKWLKCRADISSREEKLPILRAKLKEISFKRNGIAACAGWGPQL
jgi:hypothetical protein